MAVVTVRGIGKSYGDTPVLRDFDLTLPEGGITVILGPSGCGKTTLLRILAGLSEPDAGEVRLGDRVLNDPRSRVAPEARGIGMVFQDALLWPHLTARGNIGFPLGRGGKGDPRVEEAAAAAEILPFLDRYPAALSGGERQRVAIARAIVRRPRLLLLDEPLSGLDANLRVRLLATIRRVQRSLGVTACYVTHDQEEALGLADRIVVMRGGAVVQEGTPEEIYAKPETAFVAGFVGISSLLRGEEGLVAVRPETVHLVEADGRNAEVVGSAFRGDRWLVTLRMEGQELLALSPKRLAPGERVGVRIDPAPVRVADDEETR